MEVVGDGFYVVVVDVDVYDFVVELVWVVEFVVGFLVYVVEIVFGVEIVVD